MAHALADDVTTIAGEVWSLFLHNGRLAVGITAAGERRGCMQYPYILRARVAPLHLQRGQHARGAQEAV